MAVDTCIMETGDDGPVWEVKFHFPQEMKAEKVTFHKDMFKYTWETLRPNVSVGWSDKYNRLGDLGD
eukprot:12892389-Prorocentrum_lima.AAC.1